MSQSTMPAPVLLITADLACVSAVTGAAARTGTELRTALSLGAVEQKLANEPPSLVLVDLSTRGLNTGELVAKLRASVPEARVIAFGPHVHTGLLASAREAGCDLVISRGEFHARIDSYLRNIA